VWRKSFILSLLFSTPAWATGAPTYIELAPTPDAYLIGTLVSGAEGNLYMGGEVSGASGILKIDAAGNVSHFSYDGMSNLAATDSEGKNIYSLVTLGTVLFKMPLAGGPPSSVPLSPPLLSYMVGTLVMGEDGHLYVGGTSTGNVSGIYKVAQDGGVTLLVSTQALGIDIGNHMTADAAREKIFIQFGGVLKTVSMADGSVEKTVPLSPVPFDYSGVEFEAAADGRLFAVGRFNGAAPYALLSISTEGAVQPFDAYSNGSLVAGLDGKALYLVETVAGNQAPGAASRAFRSPGQDVRLRKYALIADDSSSGGTDDTGGAGGGNEASDAAAGRVDIQGGRHGYAKPGAGDVVRVRFTPAAAGRVDVKVYTLAGALVWSATKEAGPAPDFVDWTCRNTADELVASDIYVVKVEGPGLRETKKAVVIR